jgi:predicted esterase
MEGLMIEAQNEGLVYSFRPGASGDAPLVLMVHGRAGKLGVMSTFMRMIPDTAHVIQVQAPEPDEDGGFSWWDIRHKADPARGARQIEQFLVKVLPELGITPSKTVAFGYSQGGCVLSYLLLSGWASLSGLALLASFVMVPEEVPSFQGRSLPAIFWAHGETDPIVPVEKARKGVLYLESLGLPVEFHLDAVGHKVGTTGMRALKEWTYRVLGGGE